jgi:small-conductance mechanosensitive channel
MERRRVPFTFGVTYRTTMEQLKKIPDKVREIIENINNATFDRCHFKNYGNFSLDFEAVYYVETADYNVYMDIQETINLAIFRYFAEEQIEFAYPTQTLFVENTDTGTGIER